MQNQNAPRPMPARPGAQTATRQPSPSPQAQNVFRTVGQSAPARPTNGGDFWKSPAARPIRFSPFLTSDQKRDLVASGDLFEIVAVRYRPVANYGPEWNIDIVYTGLFNENGTNDFSLSLQAKPQRDHIFKGMAEFLDQNRGATIPAVLTAETANNGNWFYTIGNPYEQADDGTSPAQEFDRGELPF